MDDDDDDDNFFEESFLARLPIRTIFFQVGDEFTFKDQSLLDSKGYEPRDKADQDWSRGQKRCLQAIQQKADPIQKQKEKASKAQE